MSNDDASLLTGSQVPRRLKWYWRAPLKLFVFLVVVFFVLFPNPIQLRRHIAHISDYEAMIDADAPQLADWDRQIREQLSTEAAKKRKSAVVAPPAEPHWDDALSPKHVQKQVERFVLKNVKYGWDWDVWGSADYMPTVREMFERAAEMPGGIVREDCDGRAVMAASLMRRLGYQSSIVTDLRHVWVVTPQGEWMGPGRGKTMRSTKTGNKVNVFATLSNVPVSLSYGVAVFPLWRSFIILVAAWLLLSRRGLSRRVFWFAGLLLVQGLLFMRLGYAAPEAVSGSVQAWPSWLGLAHILFGIVFLMWCGIRQSRDQYQRRDREGAVGVH